MLCERKVYGQLRLPGPKLKHPNKVKRAKLTPKSLSPPRPGKVPDTIVCATPRNKIDVRSCAPVPDLPQPGEHQDSTRQGNHTTKIKIPKSPTFALYPQQELQRRVSLLQRRHSQRISTTTKAIEDRCACNDGCRTDSCVNRYTLVECHGGNCSLSWCENRYFTRPPRRSLTVFKTSDGRGYGLQTDAALPTGVFVVEYTGQRCPWTPGPGSNYRMDLGTGWVLDAQNIETQARYINHACKPNCKAWRWEGADREYHIGIFTDTDVRAGEELTIRYNRGANRRDKFDYPCLCGSDNCVGVLWG